MGPVRYAGNTDLFDQRRHALNVVLAFCGFQLQEDGTLTLGTAASTLTEAQERAGRLRAELQRRSVHGDVLAACREELLRDNNYFHAVLEACKSVAEKVRRLSGLATDGSVLVDQAFGRSSSSLPLVAFNTLQTDTEISEHGGLMNLLKGMFGTFRNPTAHAPKTAWKVSEPDALDLLSLASLLHRRLDSAVRTTR